MAAPTNSIPTYYDETYRGASYQYMDPSIQSMGNRVNLIGHLEHFADSTDGSFGICFAGGVGNFISKTFYESIPEAHRPPLNKDDADLPVSFLIGPETKALGSIFLPIIFTDVDTNTRFRMKLYTLVLPNLLLPMFIGTGTAGSYLSSTQYRNGIPKHTLTFPSGTSVTVLETPEDDQAGMRYLLTIRPDIY